MVNELDNPYLAPCNIATPNVLVVSTERHIPYSGKLSREKTFTNFTVLEPLAKVFSMKFGRAI